MPRVFQCSIASSNRCFATCCSCLTNVGMSPTDIFMSPCLRRMYECLNEYMHNPRIYACASQRMSTWDKELHVLSFMTLKTSEVTSREFYKLRPSWGGLRSQLHESKCKTLGNTKMSISDTLLHTLYICPKSGFFWTSCYCIPHNT